VDGPVDKVRKIGAGYLAKLRLSDKQTFLGTCPTRADYCMACGDLPTWLEATEFEDIVGPPTLSPELRAVALGLRPEIWHSPVRWLALDEPSAAIPVVALTMALSDCTVVTVVMLGLETTVADRSRRLRTVIQAYAASFSDEKWARARWFVADEVGDLSELKLQSEKGRQIWFLQEFNVS
jgi:hypothetical protein